MIGFDTFSVNALLDQGNQNISLKDRSNTVSATIEFSNINIITDQKPLFVDLLQNGLQINLAVAIYFTGSNGAPSKETSLHYISFTQLNQYETCIISTVNIVYQYDTN
jgi:hypothetical protein